MAAPAHPNPDPYRGLTDEQIAKLKAAVAAEPPLTAAQREELAAPFDYADYASPVAAS